MKMNKCCLIIPVVVAAIAAAGCSSMPSCLEISPPDIHLTGEKTVIERQIVGEYRELEKDAWIVSSVRTSITKTKGTPMATAGGDEELFKALKIREFNEEKLRIFKDEGAVGETNAGVAAYIPTQKYEGNQGLKNALMKVLEDENRARASIFERSLAKSGTEKPAPDQVAAFAKKFAEEQYALAKKNDWIQDKIGQWVKKR
ncbi:MAG: DUF1318 domain-containing protein [Spirochaetes bacterium]|nr:MAG: DUF1318 domain-containing protein [Spirochaetota bacterium]